MGEAAFLRKILEKLSNNRLENYFPVTNSMYQVFTRGVRIIFHFPLFFQIFRKTWAKFRERSTLSILAMEMILYSWRKYLLFLPTSFLFPGRIFPHPLESTNVSQSKIHLIFLKIFDTQFFIQTAKSITSLKF